MGEEIKEVDLDRTYRLGTPNYDKVRPIIRKFARYNTKGRVFRTNKNSRKQRLV